nr:protein phosphatase 1 regulatory subunit 36 isoform X2 [Geotrypetes seraphini]XP_033806851.1 protein phosphatase 1 regulatory subunit 36 isoform X2 [Geotrypetes seraphini]
MGILKLLLGPTKPSEGTFSGLAPKSSRSAGKRDQEGSVTLDDVKRVALSLLQQHAMQELSFFSAIARSQQLDDFFMALLFYLSCFLNKTSLEKNPKSIIAKCSATDEKEMTDALLQTKLAQKHLAHMYGILVLGWKMPLLHHMTCGRSRGSTTHKDRTFFECLYNFCTYLSWVAFQRKDLDVIQEEIGRLLRSDTFNFVLREKSTPEDLEIKVPAEKKKARTERRAVNKRPAIKSIINQRSPVLISLLPSPKEHAQYLFQHHKVHPSSTYIATDSKDWMNMSSTVISSRIGIIGQPRRMFNSYTLLPLEMEEEANSRKRSGASFYSFGLDASYRTNTRSGLSQPSTAVSRATTEGGYSENEL